VPRGSLPVKMAESSLPTALQVPGLDIVH